MSHSGFGKKPSDAAFVHRFRTCGIGCFSRGVLNLSRRKDENRHREVWSSLPGGKRRGGLVETRLPLILPRVFPTWPLGEDPVVSSQSPPERKNVFP
jgi:hypothetical protein